MVRKTTRVSAGASLQGETTVLPQFRSGKTLTPIERNQRLPNPGAFARAWAELVQLPPDALITVPGWIVGMAGWPRQRSTAGEVRRLCREALDRRINSRAGYAPAEPRDGETRLIRDRDRLHDAVHRRRIVRQFETVTVRRRFSHLLHADD